MSIGAEYRDGVFAPLQEVEEPTPGDVYEVFSEGELKRLAAGVPWLKGSERSFDYFNQETPGAVPFPGLLVTLTRFSKRIRIMGRVNSYRTEGFGQYARQAGDLRH